MTLQIREIFTQSFIIQDQLSPHCVIANSNGHICLTTRHSAQILEPFYRHNNDTNLHLNCSFFKSSASMPTRDLSTKAKEMYTESKDLQKQQLCLDIMLMPELSSMTHIPNLISIRWSPEGAALKKDNYLASLTNFGGCSIYYKFPHDHEWSYVIVDIGTTWATYCRRDQVHPITKMNDLQTLVSNIHITAIAWHNKIMAEKTMFAIATASGKLAIFGIRTQNLSELPSVQSPNIEFEYDLQMYKVNVLRWFSFLDAEGDLRSYLFTADFEGRLFTFSVDVHDSTVQAIDKISELWSQADKLRFGDVIIEYLSLSNTVMLVTCKGAHVLVFLLNSDGKLLDSYTHYVGNLFISGIIEVYHYI